MRKALQKLACFKKAEGIVYVLAILLFLWCLANLVLGGIFYVQTQPFRERAKAITSKRTLEELLPADPIPIEEIPQILRDAFIQVLEPRFFEYDGGFDWVGNWQAFGNHSFVPNRISLRLANLIVPFDGEAGMEIHHRAWLRHFVAHEIGKQFSKEEILFYSLNSIRFSPESRGIVDGSRIHFEKTVSELTVDEQVKLAIISLNPDYRKPDLIRDDMILQMLEQLE